MASVFERFSKSLAIVLTPVIVALIGNWYTSSIKEREREVEIMKLIPQLLSQDLPGIRLWAVDVIAKYSGVPIPEAAREEVEQQPLSLGSLRERKSSLTTDEETALLAQSHAAGTQRWMTLALRELGVREIPGESHDPRILAHHASTSLAADSDEVPWNASFVNWVIEQAGLAGTGSALARSWLSWGEPVEEPVVGCIAVLSRGSNPMAGHVGFFVAPREDGSIGLLSGNSANGGEIYRYPAERLLGCRVPAGFGAARE